MGQLSTQSSTVQTMCGVHPTTGRATPWGERNHKGIYQNRVGRLSTT